jgi:hypothetical protein
MALKVRLSGMVMLALAKIVACRHRQIFDAREMSRSICPYAGRLSSYRAREALALAQWIADGAIYRGHH